MEVSGVLMSWETLVISSVRKRSDFMRSSTAALTPSRMAFKSSACSLSSKNMPFVSTRALRSPRAISFAARRSLRACHTIYSTAGQRRTRCTIKTKPSPFPAKQMNSKSSSAPRITTQRHRNGSALSPFASSAHSFFRSLTPQPQSLQTRLFFHTVPHLTRTLRLMHQSRNCSPTSSSHTPSTMKPMALRGKLHSASGIDTMPCPVKISSVKRSSGILSTKLSRTASSSLRCPAAAIRKAKSSSPSPKLPTASQGSRFR